MRAFVSFQIRQYGNKTWIRLSENSDNMVFRRPFWLYALMIICLRTVSFMDNFDGFAAFDKFSVGGKGWSAIRTTVLHIDTVGVLTAQFKRPFKSFGFVTAFYFFFGIQGQVFSRQDGRYGFRVRCFIVVTLFHKGRIGLLQQAGVIAFVVGNDGIEFLVACGFRAFMTRQVAGKSGWGGLEAGKAIKV